MYQQQPVYSLIAEYLESDDYTKLYQITHRLISTPKFTPKTSGFKTKEWLSQLKLYDPATLREFDLDIADLSDLSILVDYTVSSLKVGMIGKKFDLTSFREFAPDIKTLSTIRIENPAVFTVAFPRLRSFHAGYNGVLSLNAPRLRELDLYGTIIDTTILVKNSPRLKRLRLHECTVIHAGLITQLPLKHLILTESSLDVPLHTIINKLELVTLETEIKDDLSQYHFPTTLEEITLEVGQSVDLTLFQPLPNLFKLALYALTDNLKLSGRFNETLEELTIARFHLDRTTWRSLRYLSLIKLELNDCEIPATALKYIRGMTELSELDVGNNHDIDDTSLEYLTNLHRLTTVRLTSTSVTQAGVDMLKRTLPHVIVEYLIRLPRVARVV